jgi:hypothetical protein
MTRYSTRQAAKKLAIAPNTLSQYIAAGKVPSPKEVIAGIRPTHLWTDEEIEIVRKLLPKIANGRKTRYQKLRDKQKAPPRAAVPHKGRSKKKK